MLELGRKSAMFHRELGKQLVSQGFSIVFLFGRKTIHTFRYIKKHSKIKVFHFSDRERLTEALIKTLHKGDVIVIKGSHKNRLDLVADTIIKDLKENT
ncbi:MAG: hypothetical protein B5M53_11715 [Candidatus Cloacimonas sp. 4484_209]|nr:MAG: hypothetical protein B5M53_11715 [Candidatus Cloacimonas sp. 4484_209]